MAPTKEHLEKPAYPDSRCSFSVSEDNITELGVALSVLQLINIIRSDESGGENAPAPPALGSAAGQPCALFATLVYVTDPYHQTPTLRTP